MWAAPASRALRANPAPRSLYGPSTSAPLLPGHLANPALADNRHLYLARILEVTLYLLGDVVGQLGGDTVVHFGGLDHYPYLTSGLDRIGFVYASVAEGDVLQGAQALYVGLRRLAPGAGAGRRDCVCSGDQHVLHLTALLRESASDQGVGALDFVVYGLPDIVQQGGSAGDLDVGTELLGHHAAEVGYFDRVGEHVLAVGCPVFQRAEKPQQVVVHSARDLGVVERLAACGLDLLLHVLAGLRDDLLDAPRVDAPVLHEPFHRDPRHLAPDRVEAGDHHRLGGVIDDYIHAGGGLEGPDVPAFAAYDPTLHVVGGKRYGLYRRLRGEIRSEALHGGGDQTPRLDVGPLLGLQGHVAHHAPEPALELGFQVGEESPLGLLPRQARDLLEHPELVGLPLPQLIFLAPGRLFGFRKPAPAFVELALAPL